MAQTPNHFDQLNAGHAPEQFLQWSYRRPDGATLPYAAGFHYFDPHGMGIGALDASNRREAEGALLSDTGLSIHNNQGLYVGVGILPDNTAQRGSQKMQRLQFKLPFNLEEGDSGRQPPITSLYPRVSFPAFAAHKYGLVVMWDGGLFGTSYESFTAEVHQGARADDFDIPLDIPCHDAIRAALNQFNDEPWCGFHSGSYKISIELERTPILCARIDGKLPLVVRELHDRTIPAELPINDLSAPTIPLSLDFTKLVTSGPTQRRDPLSSHPRSTDKYAEQPVTVPATAEQGGMYFETCSLTYGVRGAASREESPLIYRTLSRPESVAESTVNPHLGLVEIQIGRGAKVVKCTIDFTPKQIAAPQRRFDDTLKGMGDLGAFGITRGGSSSFSPMISTGKTELGTPRKAEVLPKSEITWDKHLQTFRFCLTNEA